MSQAATANSHAQTALRKNLQSLDVLHEWLDRSPYSIPLYLEVSLVYQRLAYPDLAAGSAYKALLLADATLDPFDEFHDQAVEAVAKTFSSVPPGLLSVCPDFVNDPEAPPRGGEDGEDSDAASEAVVAWLKGTVLSLIYCMLVDSLIECRCYRSAYRQIQQGLAALPNDDALQTRRLALKQQMADQGAEDDPETWSDSSLVRRECYPWNDVEPDRYSQESLDHVNTKMAECAPKLEVRAVMLPVLTAEGTSKLVKQLGVFAKEDIAPGQMVLEEASLLTANNRLQDALCDACNTDLPPGSSHVLCEECTVPFCSVECYDAAQASYHPALCDKDVDSLAKDVPPAQAADSLYLLLLLRSLAMALTQERHPLALDEVKYIWGDYSTVDIDRLWSEAEVSSSPIPSFPRSLPFSFDMNVVLPFHMLTKMDVDIFASHRDFDVWIFNTLYAKFRGTASARLSGKSSLGGLKLSKARGPEVCAVHPCWCLANHSCDPNVSWEWGGKVQFHARKERVVWASQGGDGVLKNTPGIKKDEEILNHYCDIGLSVQQRREWAAGALGGHCECPRCMYEAGGV